MVRTLAISQLAPTIILTCDPTWPDIATEGSECDWSAASVGPSMRICEPEPAISTTSPIADNFSVADLPGVGLESSVKLLTSLRNSRRFGCSSMLTHSFGCLWGKGLRVSG